MKHDVHYVPVVYTTLILNKKCNVATIVLETWDRFVGYNQTTKFYPIFLSSLIGCEFNHYQLNIHCCSKCLNVGFFANSQSHYKSRE